MKKIIDVESYRNLFSLYEEQDKWCRELMPDTKSALKLLFLAYQRLKELGWKDSTYAPKGRNIPMSEFIEVGSTGIHKGFCEDRPISQFPVKWYWLVGNDDLWPSHPILFREPQDNEVIQKL